MQARNPSELTPGSWHTLLQFTWLSLLLLQTLHGDALSTPLLGFVSSEAYTRGM